MAAWPPAREATDDELRGNGGDNDLKLSVDVLNINISTGDSGLFLLIQHPPPTSAEVKPFIHRAVLIDGGIGNTGADAIVKAFEKVAQMYIWDRNQGGRENLAYPPLDSIGVTHWDNDHATGLLTFFSRIVKAGATELDFDENTYLCPLMKYQSAAKGSPRALRAMTTFYAPYWDGPKFPPRTGLWRESTPDDQKALPKGLGAVAYLHWKYRNNDMFTVQNLCKLRTHVDVVLGVNLFIGDTTPQMNMNTALAMPTPQHLALWHKFGGRVSIADLLAAAPEPKNAWPVLCIVAGARGGLGGAVNVCCGQSAAGRNEETEITAMKNKFAGSLDALDEEPRGEQEKEIQDYFDARAASSTSSNSSSSSNGSSSNGGGGSGGGSGGDGSSSSIVTDHSSSSSITATTDASTSSSSSGGGTMISSLAARSPMPTTSTLAAPGRRDSQANVAGPPGIFRPAQRIINVATVSSDEEHFSNMHSLVTMVIWTTGQLSLFSGGDANWENELKVAAWCQQDANPFKCVRSVKLSHHGSHFSTPSEMIRAFRPRNIIISADTSNHGHPRWEILFFLYLWYGITGKARFSISLDNHIQPGYFVRSTAYPYYLAHNEKKGTFKRNISNKYVAFREDADTHPDEYKAFQLLIIRMSTLVFGGDRYVAAFQSYPPNATVQQREWMNREIKNAWDTLSEVGHESTQMFTVNDSDVERYALMSKDSPEKIIFVRTLCRPYDLGRRTQADGYIDGAAYPVKVKHDVKQLLRAAQTAARSYQGMKGIVSRAIRRTGALKQWRFLSDHFGGKAASTTALTRIRQRIKEASEAERNIGVPSPTMILERGELQELSKFLTELMAMPLAEDNATVATATPTPLIPDQDFILVPNAPDVDWAKAVGGSIYKVPAGPKEEDIDDIAVVMLMLTDSNILNLNKDCSLKSDDPLRGWVLQALREDPTDAKTSISFSLTGKQERANVAAITITLPESKTRPAMVFSTSSLAKNFSDRNLPSMRKRELVINDSGYNPMHAFLCLGLVPDEPKKPWSIAQIFGHINVNPNAGDRAKNLGVVMGAALDMLTGVADPGFVLNKGMIWFLPRENYAVVQRLEWGLGKNSKDALESWCRDWFPLNSKKNPLVIENPTIVSRRSCVRMENRANYSLSFTHQMLFMFDITRDGISPDKDYVITCGLDLNLEESSASAIITLRVDPATPKTKVGLLSFLAWLIPDLDTGPVGKMIPALDQVLVRSVELKISRGTDKKITVEQVTVRAEYSNPSWKVKNARGGEEVVAFLLTYTWRRDRPQPHGVNISLWLEPTILSWFSPQIMPKYEDLYYISPSHLAPGYLSLNDLMPGDYRLPAELSLVIQELSLDLEDTTVTFIGKLGKDPTVDTENLGISLDEVDLTASFKWDPKTEDKTQTDRSSYEINLRTVISLPADTPPQDSAADEEKEDATIMVNVNLITETVDGNKTTRFKLEGQVANLNMAQLVRFFPPGDADIVKDLLGHIEIPELNLEYNYESSSDKGTNKPSSNPPGNAKPKGASASDFSISGKLRLADAVDLDIDFKRTPTGWSFDATLKSAQTKLTVGKVVQALLGDGGGAAISDIPDFVKSIDLARAFIKLSLRSVKLETDKDGNTAISAPQDGKKPGSFTICLSLVIPGPENTKLELAFLQTTTKPTPTTAPTNIQAATKRMIKVTLGGLPWDKIPKIPVVDNIKPAFDSLGFYWVQDPTWKDVKLQPGLTRQEVQRLSELSPVLFKETKPATGANDPVAAAKAASAIVLPAGMHFLILDSGGQGAPRAVLDYLFNKPKKPASAGIASFAPRTTALPPPEADPRPTGTSNATLEKKVGPFSVSNVGIRYENDELIIFLDIHANLGPIKLVLMGFGFGMNLKKVNLKDITSAVPSFHLAGMGVEFNQPPVGVTGMFVERKTEDVKMYVGGIALTIMPYSFMAVGAYGEVKKRGSTTGETFKTVFFFAKLNGPLIELEFVTVGGICLGFGYNSSIRFPTVQEVPSFPFIANSALPGDNPLAVMEKLSSLDPTVGVVAPKEYSYWLAAGLEAKALQVLDVSAVVILEFNPYVSLGIFGKAVAQMPPAPTPREACFLYVELGLLALVDFGAGSLRVEAELSPNSFIVAPGCRLTGGFALCYWFPPSGYAGDFVFSVGGYHAAFKPPAHYPRPSRLGISWALSDELSIRGEAYFAITPKVCMGGGKYTVNFDAGLLHAWLTAWADFLMQYHPFKFIADIGLEVGVKFTLELLFISIDISITLRAELTLWGVPFGGEVYVDFWVFGFTIGFGEGQNDPAITLAAFKDLLMQVPDADSAQAAGDQSGTVDRMHIISVETGRYTEKAKEGDSTTKQGDIWEVKRGGFVFRVQSRVPLQYVEQPKFAKDKEKRAVTRVESSTPFFARPMHLEDQLTSSMTVSIRKHELVTVVEDTPTGPVTTTKHDDGPDLEFTPVKSVLKQVPLALWGFYDPDKAPGRGRNNVGDLLDPKGGTAELMMGASFHCPPPSISDDKMVPIDVLTSSSVDVFTNADDDNPDDDKSEHPKLSGDVVIQDGTWNSAEPVTDPKNKAKPWETARDAWKKPTVEVAPQAETGVSDVLDATAALWSDAFGWDLGDADNHLKNEVHSRGKSVLVWDDFEGQYMAAPLVGVVA